MSLGVTSVGNPPTCPFSASPRRNPAGGLAGLDCLTAESVMLHAVRTLMLVEVVIDPQPGDGTQLRAGAPPRRISPADRLRHPSLLIY